MPRERFNHTEGCNGPVFLSFSVLCVDSIADTVAFGERCEDISLVVRVWKQLTFIGYYMAFPVVFEFNIRNIVLLEGGRFRLFPLCNVAHPTRRRYELLAVCGC